MKLKLLILSVAFLTAINTLAYDFISNNIAYTITSSSIPYTVEVSSGISYTSAITIPTSVSKNDILYSVTAIGDFAFASCNGLTSVTIPGSIISIGISAFENCSTLTSITVEDNNPNYSTFDGMLFNKDITTLICCPKGKTGSISIPTTVTQIGYHAFISCSNVTSIFIPNSVTSIYIGVFANCTGLTTITIPNSVTNIGPWSFLGCSNLTSIHVQNSVPISLSYIYIDDIFDYDTYRTCTLYVPEGFKSVYQRANLWENFVNIKEETIDDLKMISTGDISVIRQGKQAILDNLHNGEKIQIFTIDGKLIFSKNTTKKSLCIELTENETYIIKIGTKSTKIIFQ